MESRIAAANRRKQLLAKEKAFVRQQKLEAKVVDHDVLMERRREVAKTAEDDKAAGYETYYCASGSGSAWRSREHVTLKHSPRNLRKGVDEIVDKGGNELTYKKDNENKKKEMKPISADLYSRLSFQKNKVSTADADEYVY